MKVLIADDEDLNRKILCETLEDEGFEVVSASDGLQAIQQLEAHSDVKLILLDRMMPNMGGMEVMEKLQANPMWKDIPVIMQTAANSEEEVIDGVSSGVHYYLAKPFDDDVLIDIVHDAIS